VCHTVGCIWRFPKFEDRHFLQIQFKRLAGIYLDCLLNQERRQEDQGLFLEKGQEQKKEEDVGKRGRELSLCRRREGWAGGAKGKGGGS
jgi:hypothetical protein